MRSKAPRAFSLWLACFAFVGMAVGADWRDVELRLPRELQAGDTVFLEVELGALPRGREVHLTTASGRELGTLSPYAVRAGRDAGIYDLPIPSEFFVERRLVVRLSVNSSNHQERAPTAEEVKAVRVKIVHVAR